MSVRKTARFLPLKRISEVVLDSESEGAEASSNTVIYLGNSIFRQLLKYPYFSYPFLDGVRKYHVEILDSPS
jgi:hypothetical protein